MKQAALVYDTNSGSTYQVAMLVADGLTANGWSVKVHRADQADNLVFAQTDLVLLGSPTWEWVKANERLEGQLSDYMRAFLARVDRTHLSGQKFALFACGDSSYTDFCAAADHLESFVKEVGGVLACPTLRIDSFYFNLEANRRLTTEWATKIH